MLLRHTALYTLARGLPGLINFGALALYTRLLAPADYGTYALIIAWVGLSNAVVFQWIRSAARRFLPAHRSDPGALLRSLMAGYMAMLAPTALVAAVLLFVIPSPALRTLIVLALLLLWLQAFFELSLELVLAGLQPQRYGVLAMAKATMALAIGGLLVYWGFGAGGILVGIALGLLVPVVVMLRREWSGIAPSFRDRETLGALLRYGLPLSATFILEYAINSSDRLLLGRMNGTDAVGTYAVAYDLSQQGLYALMLVVYLAGFPLAVKALESGGIEAAQAQLRRHATLLLAIALPAAAGLALLAPNVAQVLLGPGFQAGATGLIPWIAAAALLSGLKAYYFDLAFQLGRATLLQLWVGGLIAVLNVGLNLWWIPIHGAAGAAYSTLVSFAAAILLSAWLGRRAFPMPLPVNQWIRIAAGTFVMLAGLLPLLAYRGVGALALQVGWGMLVYALALLVLNVAGIRTVASRFLRG